MSQLSMFDRTIVGYAGVPAARVADAERVTLQAVRDSRERMGRAPSDGQPVSVHLQQAHRHAQRARDLQRAEMDADAQAAWGEANFQASLALLDELMRRNRNRWL
jgi:hypothetical protein